MDDFNGTFCNEGPFPVVSAVSQCFKDAMTSTTTTTTTRTTTKPSSVFDPFDYNNPPKRPVLEVFIQGDLMDKNNIFDYDDGDWLMLNGMMSSCGTCKLPNTFILFAAVVRLVKCFY